MPDEVVEGQEEAFPELPARAIEAGVDVAIEEALDKAELSEEVKEYLVQRAATLMYQRWTQSEDYRIRLAKKLRARRKQERASRRRNRR